MIWITLIIGAPLLLIAIAYKVASIKDMFRDIKQTAERNVA